MAIISAMIFGHMALVGIAKLTAFRQENLAIMTLASFGPDILDKPANIFLGMPGRGISHSLLVFAILLFVASIYWLKINNNPRLLAATTSLWGSHLIGDFVEPNVMFWPLAGPLYAQSKFHFSKKLLAFYIDFQHPYQLVFELLSILGACAFILYCLGVFNTQLRPVLSPGRSLQDRYTALRQDVTDTDKFF